MGLLGVGCEDRPWKESAFPSWRIDNGTIAVPDSREVGLRQGAGSRGDAEPDAVKFK